MTMPKKDLCVMPNGHQLEVDVSDEDWRHARLIFSEFKSKPGSEYIATEFALAHLSAILTTRRPQTVLEFGAGIGTITKLLVTHPHRPRVIVTTENNEYCISAFNENIDESILTSVTLVRSLDELLAQDQTYDLVIGDGGFYNKAAFKGVSEDTTFFFDGSRAAHRKLLRAYLAENGLGYSERNYPRPGIKFVFKKNPYRFWGVSIPRPKIKRRKGCWVGSATVDSHR